MNTNVIYWDVDPVIFWITDTFPLKYYGLLFSLGILLGYQVVKRLYVNERVPIESLDKLFIYIVVGIVVGARLGHCFFYEPTYYFEHPIEIFLPIKKIGTSYEFIGFQGLASHGGGIGVLIAIGLYCKKYKFNFLWVLDRVAIAVPLVGAFIRFGNFMNSEIYGKPTNGNWGVVFVKDDLIPRHPTQLYEAISYLCIFFILFILKYRMKANYKNGLLVGVFLVLLFLARFIIEFFKENQVAFEDSMTLNMGQILSIPFILIGIGLIIFSGKEKVV
ncbi:prolipoprotein diacylglyceryl transferase [Joostella sp.]|uniref:prolipoprotein diacylglyceryl transferase n=1 Tax=Joostella sp. TaxID=2231138 RepID=UPI003A8FC63E